MHQHTVNQRRLSQFLLTPARNGDPWMLTTCSCMAELKEWRYTWSVHASATKIGDTVLDCSRQSPKGWRYGSVHACQGSKGWRYLDYSCENLKRWRTWTVHATEFPKYVYLDCHARFPKNGVNSFVLPEQKGWRYLYCSCQSPKE
jgi:hypothetical protein